MKTKLKLKMTCSPTDAMAAKLKQTVYELCLPGGRMVGTAGHDVAEKYITERLTAAGCEPYAGDSFALPYSRQGQDFVNLVGVIPGADRTLAPILIGAHYDSVIPHPCADDNGAAVAIAIGGGRNRKPGWRRIAGSCHRDF